MSIKIHHGPPGSYKTSGAVMDDFIPAAKAGRVVVTNVRGLENRDHIDEVLGGLPDSFDLIYLPTTEHPDAAQNREALSRFWHWAPLGCLLLLDECPTLFPKSWRPKDIEALAFPGGLDAATVQGRPYDWNTAWDMHRHYGWDIVLTTPAISKVRADIRSVAEGAYKHKNLKTVGIGGRYLEAFHLADLPGNTSNYLNVRTRKITKEVWLLYASTATGTHSDTLAGTPFWANAKVLVLGALLCVCGLALFFLLGRTKSAPGAPVPRSGPPAVVPAVAAVVPPRVPPGDALVARSGSPVRPPVKPARFSMFSGYRWRIWGEHSQGTRLILRFEGVSPDGALLRVTSGDLVGVGIAVTRLRKCLALLDGQPVTCAAFPALDAARGVGGESSTGGHSSISGPLAMIAKPQP